MKQNYDLFLFEGSIREGKFQLFATVQNVENGYFDPEKLKYFVDRSPLFRERMRHIKKLTDFLSNLPILHKDQMQNEDEIKKVLTRPPYVFIQTGYSGFEGNAEGIYEHEYRNGGTCELLLSNYKEISPLANERDRGTRKTRSIPIEYILDFEILWRGESSDGIGN